MKTEEKTAMPAGFPRVFFNRIKRGTAGHPVEETVCFSYDSHTGENGKTVKENVRRIGVIRGSSGLGEIEFNDRFLRASPQYEKFIARRTATGNPLHSAVL